MDKDCFVRKFRFNQSFHLIGAEDFLKALVNSPVVQARLPFLQHVGTSSGLSYKQISCEVLNLSYFDFLEELDIINGATGMIRGAPDEWVDEMQLGNKLRLAMLWEDDDNYCDLQEDKY